MSIQDLQKDGTNLRVMQKHTTSFVYNTTQNKSYLNPMQIGIFIYNIIIILFIYYF